MALVALGSMLKAGQIPFELIDFDLELQNKPLLSQWHYFKDYALRRLKKTDTRCFGISSICSNYPVSLLLAKAIKERWPRSCIILGGPQPSAVPEETLRLCPWVDVIVIGEGEWTCVELMKSDLSAESLRTIAGIVFRDGDEIVRTERRPLIEDLDTLPFPDYSLVPLKEYLPITNHVDLIEAGRGCPFLCSFCSTALMWERKFRVKSPARILEEMRRLNADYGLVSFGLTHDNFTTSHRHVAAFCEYFRTHNHEQFIWSASARSDTLNPERIQALYDAGCRGLFFGVDSGSVRMQKVMKKQLNLAQFKEHHNISSHLGMSSITSLILGFPEETAEDVDATIRLGLWAKLNGSSTVQFHRLSVLPSTALSKQHHGALFFDTQKTSWDFDRQSHESREIDRQIRKSPELFSTFYTLPTPLLGSINIEALAFFYHELVNFMAPTLDHIFMVTGWSTVELFECWLRWKENYYPKRRVSGPFIFNTFAEFVRKEVTRSEGNGFNIQQEAL